MPGVVHRRISSGNIRKYFRNKFKYVEKVHLDLFRHIKASYNQATKYQHLTTTQIIHWPNIESFWPIDETLSGQNYISLPMKNLYIMKNVFLISVLLSAFLGACTPAMQKVNYSWNCRMIVRHPTEWQLPQMATWSWLVRTLPICRNQPAWCGLLKTGKSANGWMYPY